MLNFIWLALILAAVVVGGINGSLDAVSKEAFDRVEFAVMKLALPLAGIMALWLGVMRLAEKSGLIQVLARALSPVMRRLFPDVPADHPAMGSMLMNMSANMLGLNNAATPLGLRAMQDLETLNPRPGTATNAMCTFLAINTSSIQLIPATAVGVLAVGGAHNPTAIIGTAIIATTCSTIVGVVAVKLLEKLPGYQLPPVTADQLKPVTRLAAEDAVQVSTPLPLAPLTLAGKFALLAFAGIFVWAFLRVGFPELLGQTASAELSANNFFVRTVTGISVISIPLLISFFPFYAALRKLKVYEEFVEGAKEGFQVSVTILPFLVAMLVAIGMFRAAGGIEMFTQLCRPLLDALGFPTELLPMSLVRPLSGSGSLGLFTDLVKQFGPDSLIARTAGTIYGSTETTFYVIAVYFGSVNVRRTRHALPAGLLADAAGVVASVVICRVMFR